MIDHVSLGVRSLHDSVLFYDNVLLPLDHTRVWRNEHGAGYGPNPADPTDYGFAIVPLQGLAPGLLIPPRIGFIARDRDSVDAFHATALRLAGISEKAPAPHPAYGPDAYATTIRDPDGHALEAVFRGRCPWQPLTPFR